MGDMDQINFFVTNLTINLEICNLMLFTIKASDKCFDGFSLREVLLVIFQRDILLQKKQSGLADPLCLYYFSSALEIAFAEAIFAV